MCLAPPASDPNISCKSSYHASNSAPHSGATPGGYIHSAVISTNQLVRTDTTTQHAPTPSTPDLAQKIIKFFFKLFYVKGKKKKKSRTLYLTPLKKKRKKKPHMVQGSTAIEITKRKSKLKWPDIDMKIFSCLRTLSGQMELLQRSQVHQIMPLPAVRTKPR